jgi:phage gp45-like
MKYIKNAVKKSINNIRTSIMGIISSTLSDTNEVNMRLYDEEEIRDVKIISPYGIFSIPLNDQSGQIIFNNSNNTASLIGVEHEELPVLINPGEVIIYCETDSFILLKDGKIYFKGDLNVDGNIIYSGNITKGSVNIQ